MSKLKVALESATSTLERELSRIQTLVEEWGRRGAVDSIERDELDLLKHEYENITLSRDVSDALEFCEDNDDDVSRVESQDNKHGTYFSVLASRIEEYFSGLRSDVNQLESRVRDSQDSALFSNKNEALRSRISLTSGPIPSRSDLQRSLRRALEDEGDYARSPEQLLWDMAEGSSGGEDEDDTLAFCRLFDFKTEFDGIETHSVVPWTGDEYPWYIGGVFDDEEREYDCDDPNNFVCVALKQLDDLREEYSDAYSFDLSEDEKVELNERMKQKARSIMYRVVDEAHEKYGAYRDRIIASVRNKQDEYGLSGDVVSAFSNYVTRSISTLIKNVENEFSEETQFHGDGSWGAFRPY